MFGWNEKDGKMIKEKEEGKWTSGCVVMWICEGDETKWVSWKLEEMCGWSY